ncbi:MAG: hypothetical protein OQL06_10945 [Gammaproteobacteria bacterium]|nr:hypothetical protein [Gammaproteobacteria bacterium]
MKAIKIIFIIIVLIITAVLSAPLWGGCEFNNQLCSLWCEARHFDSSFNETTCKGSCVADKLSCLAK